MNYRNKAAAIVPILLLSAFDSAAGKEAQFRISGRIMPQTCNISISNDNYQLGDIGPYIFDKPIGYIINDNPNNSKKRLIKIDTEENQDSILKITCPQTSRVGFNIVDSNRNNDVPDGVGFGLGITAENKNIGMYYIKIKPDTSKIDNNQSSITYTSGINMDNAKNLLLRDNKLIPNHIYKWGDIEGKSEGRDFEVAIYHEVYLEENLDKTQEVHLNGLATFTLKYL